MKDAAVSEPHFLLSHLLMVSYLCECSFLIRLTLNAIEMSIHVITYTIIISPFADFIILLFLPTDVRVTGF